MPSYFSSRSRAPPIVDLGFDPDENMEDSSDGPENDQLDAEKVSEIGAELSSSLNVINTGPVTGFNRLQNLPDLQIQIGDSSIGLPLREKDAETIIQAARDQLAQVDQTAEVDPNTRNVWELSPEQFEIRSLEWDAYLKELVAKVAHEMNPEGAEREFWFHAELVKMILYEPGATFDDQQT